MVVVAFLVPAPIKAEPIPDPPRMGAVMTAGSDSAIVLGALTPWGSGAVAAVASLRGQTGRRGMHITDCQTGGTIRELPDGPLRRWRPDGISINDLVARAACATFQMEDES